MIDTDKMSSDEVAKVPQEWLKNHEINQMVFEALDKPKRKQQGREPTQLEIEFGNHLWHRKKDVLIVDYWIKPMILRIGPDMTFEPDFVVQDGGNSLWIIDTKGPQSWEDSRIKIKIAAEKFPCWRWLIVTRLKDQWRAREVTAARGIGRRYISLPWIGVTP